MNNLQLAEILEQTALLLEFREGPSFVVEEFFKASERVGRLETPLELFENATETETGEEELDRMLAFWFGDIFRDVVWNLRETILSGSSTLYERLTSEISSSAVELLRLKTLEPRTVGILRETMNIRNVAALKIACKRGALRRSNEFTAQDELDILEEICALEEADARRAKGANRSSDAALYETAAESERRESELKIDDENMIFSANADALADFVLRELEELTRSKTASATLNPKELISEENLETAIAQAKGVWGKIRRFFTSRSDPKYVRLQFEEAERRQALERRRAEAAVAAAPAWTRIEKVGALRRRKDAISSFDFLVETTDSALAFSRIKAAAFVDKVLSEELGRLSVSFKSDAFVMPFNSRPTPAATLNFFAASDFVFGARQLFLSSTLEHWQALRDRATKRGWTLTTFGLYDGAKRITSRKENRIYEKLDLTPIPAELRENRAEWDWGDAGAPELTTLDDLRGDLHLHSNFTDGTAELDQIVENAQNLGLEYVAATDHTKNVASAGGMNDDEFLRYWDYIDDLNRKLNEKGVGFRVLKGAEVDILDDGGLDLKDETLARADWIVASLHFGLEQESRRLQARYLDAFRNPFVDVIAHPTGRMIGSQAPMAIEVAFLIESAAKYGKFLELNAQPRRLDLNVDGLFAAKKAGVPIVISTDSHALEHMTYLQFGVEQARRAGLTKNDVANAAPLDELLRRRDALKANAKR